MAGGGGAGGAGASDAAARAVGAWLRRAAALAAARVRAALALSLPPVLALRVGLDVLRRALGALRWLVRRVLELQGGVRRLRSEGCATGWEGTLSLFRGFVQLQSAWRLQVGGGPVCPAGASPPPADLEQGGSAGSHFFSVDSGLTPLAYEPSFSTRAASGASGSTGGVTIGSHVRATSGSSGLSLGPAARPTHSFGGGADRPASRAGVPPMWQSVSYGALRSQPLPGGAMPAGARYAAGGGPDSSRAPPSNSASASASASASISRPDLGESPTFGSFSHRVAFFEAGGRSAPGRPLRETNGGATWVSPAKPVPSPVAAAAAAAAAAGREKENVAAF